MMSDVCSFLKGLGVGAVEGILHLGLIRTVTLEALE